MRVVVPIAVTLLVGVAVLVLLAWPGETEGSLQPHSSDGRVTEPAVVTAPAPKTSAVTRLPAAGSQPTAAAPALLLLRVVHAGAPVAGAEILFAPEPADDVASAERRAATSGRVERSDADGGVRVPRPSDDSYPVFARHGRLWGETWVNRDSKDGHELQLQLDSTVRARLRDEALAPVASAEIALADAAWEGRFVNAMRRLTDGDGVATFTHVQARLHRGNDQRHAIIGLDLPLREPVRASVDLLAIPSEPIELRLPAAGSVVLELVDGEEPFTPPEPLQVKVSATIAASGRNAHAPEEIWAAKSMLRLPHVALGLQLRVEIEDDRCTASAEFPGPTRIGEEVRARVRVHPQPMLVGRLLRPDRTPLPGGWRANFAVTAKWTSYRVFFVSGDDGRFRMPLPPAFGDGKHATFVIEPSRDEPPDERTQGRVDLPRALLAQRGGEHDLGDVVVGPMPVLAAGVVVDSTGAPVAEATVRVQHVEPGVIRESDLATSATSAADGTFTVRGHVPDLGLHLVVAKADHESTRVAFRAGATDLRLVVRGMGVIEGRVLLAPWVRPQDVMVSWEEHGANKVSTMGGHIVLRDASTLKLQGVTPGLATVSLRATGAADAAVVLRDVPVRDGQITRLPDIDLRDKLHALELRVTDDAGAPVPIAFVVVNPFAGSAGEREALRVTAGLLHLAVQTPDVDLAVHAPGYRAAVARSVRDQVTVVLRAGISIRIEAGEFGPLQDSMQLVAVLVPEPSPIRSGRRHDRMQDYRDAYEITRGDASELGVKREALDAAGVALVQVPAAGRYKVTWELRRGEDTVPVADPQAPVITVDESGQTPTFQVAVPAAGLADAKRKLAQ